MKISIITATYNSARTLRDTFESVLAQTYRDIEYIIVDGASRDATLDIIREYEPRFEGKMKWVSEPDKGLYDAMNKGIARATGDVVGILNSDDSIQTSTYWNTLWRSSAPPVPMRSMATCTTSAKRTCHTVCATIARVLSRPG